MTPVLRAELALFTQRRTLLWSGLLAAVFAAITALATLLSAVPAAEASPDQPTIESLEAAGGATESFRNGTGFLGVLVLVTFAARVAGEFSHGTLRTMLMHEPRRGRLVAGKVIGLLVFAAGLLAVSSALGALVSWSLASGQDIDTAAWFSFDGIGAAAGNYLSGLAGVAAWGCFGTLLAVMWRSVPVAVAVGVAWFGPFEHLVSEAWSAGLDYFPGLQVQALASGGTTDVTYQHALILSLGYATVAATLGWLNVSRRDVTG